MARRKSSRGRVLVSAKGRKNYKNIEEYKNKIKTDPNLTDAEKEATLYDLDIYIDQRIKENKSSSGKRLTTHGFEGWESDTELERMFANVGMSAEEVAEEYGLDEQELLDPNNWNGAVFKGQYEFNFTYTGTIMKKL